MSIEVMDNRVREMQREKCRELSQIKGRMVLVFLRLISLLHGCYL